MTLRQHAARRLAAAVMKHEGEGWSTRPKLPLTLPKTWFGRDERRPEETEETEETKEEETTSAAVRTAVVQVAMGNCEEEHRRAWAGHWFASSARNRRRRPEPPRARSRGQFRLVGRRRRHRLGGLRPGFPGFGL